MYFGVYPLFRRHHATTSVHDPFLRIGCTGPSIVREHSRTDDDCVLQRVRLGSSHEGVLVVSSLGVARVWVREVPDVKCERMATGVVPCGTAGWQWNSIGGEVLLLTHITTHECC